MTYRRQVNKPTAVLWVLVVVADLALLPASAGAAAVVALATVLTTVLAGAAVLWWLVRSGGDIRMPLPAAVRVAARRR